MEADFKLRPYKESDLNFIRNSWAKSYYKGAEYVDFLSPNEFNEKHRPIREEILNRPNIALVVACSANEQDLILGWILVEKPSRGTTLHYLYVKEAFKKEGVFDELLEKTLKDPPVMVTHMTDRASKIIAAKADRFKDFVWSKEQIMLRDKYKHVLKGEKCSMSGKK